MVKKIVSVSATCLVLLVGCGGGSSDEPTVDTNSDTVNTDTADGANSDSTTVLTGIFVDSAVEGVSYSTATQSGTTNSAGEFNYVEGEQVTFSIGAAELPAAAAASQVSPVEMAVGSSNPADTTTNIARLLQSLDIDGNPDNGITISPDAAANAAFINFDVSTDQFANDAAVINLVANSGSVNSELISAADANQHLNSTLGIDGSDDNQADNGIVLDLRGTTWEQNRDIGCDGMDNTVVLTYTDTEMSASVSRAEDRGNGCVRDEGVRGPNTFAEWNNTAAFIHVCGDDGQCTIDEVNREVLVPVGDPRNDCSQNGTPTEVLHRISHVVGSGVITTYNCQPDEADIWTLVR